MAIYKYLKHTLSKTELLIKPLSPQASALYIFGYYYFLGTKWQKQKGGFHIIFNS